MIFKKDYDLGSLEGKSEKFSETILLNFFFWGIRFARDCWEDSFYNWFWIKIIRRVR